MSHVVLSSENVFVWLQEVVHHHFLRPLAFGLLGGTVRGCSVAAASLEHRLWMVVGTSFVVLRGRYCVVTHHFLLLLHIHCHLINVFVVSMVAYRCHGGSLRGPLRCRGDRFLIIQQSRNMVG